MTAIAKAIDDEAAIGSAGIGVPAPQADGEPALIHVLPLMSGDIRARIAPRASAALFRVTELPRRQQRWQRCSTLPRRRCGRLSISSLVSPRWRYPGAGRRQVGHPDNDTQDPPGQHFRQDGHVTATGPHPSGQKIFPTL